MPPNGAISVEMMPSLMLTMPLPSSASREGLAVGHLFINHP
jgi:hypothetical protein